MQVTKETAGTYTAYFKTMDGYELIDQSIPIKVIVVDAFEKPVFTQRPRELYNVKAGDTLTVPCKAFGIPEPKMHLYRVRRVPRIFHCSMSLKKTNLLGLFGAQATAIPDLQSLF